jgi:hypothetical protein
MAYEVVENFAAGLDNRKSPLTAPGGTLTRLINAAVNPGGEIEKRRAFVKVGSNILAGTFGLAATSGTLFAFTKNTDVTPPAFPIPGTGLVFQKIPNSDANLAQTDFDTFDGKIYLACHTIAGPNPVLPVAPTAAQNPHYYNAVLTEGAGKGYYVRTYQSKVYSVVNKYLYFSAINDPNLWNAPATFTAVTVTSLSSSNPARATVAAGDIAKFKDGMFVTIAGGTGVCAPANGSQQISDVGTPANTFTLNGANTAGGAAQTTGVTATPSPATGRGFINLSLQDSDSETLTSLEVYYDKLAIFSTEAVQLWAVDPDPLQNAYVQLLRGTGTNSPRSTSQYGSGDVLYLDQSGIRSLKAKDSSNSAAVSDIGSPIDPLIDDIAAVSGQTYFNKATALLEPLVGRFWMAFPDKIYVLSYFPGPKITAWSVYNPGFTIDYAAACGGRLYFRSGNELYVYGGPAGHDYDNCGVEVRLPYLNGKKPGNNKIFEAVDLSISGTWEARVSYDFNNPDSEEVVGTFAQSTWNGGRMELTGYASHISLRFFNNDANPAIISNVAVHYQVVDDEQ